MSHGSCLQVYLFQIEISITRTKPIILTAKPAATIRADRRGRRHGGWSTSARAGGSTPTRRRVASARCRPAGGLCPRGRPGARRDIVTATPAVDTDQASAEPQRARTRARQRAADARRRRRTQRTLPGTSGPTATSPHARPGARRDIVTVTSAVCRLGGGRTAWLAARWGAGVVRMRWAQRTRRRRRRAGTLAEGWPAQLSTG